MPAVFTPWLLPAPDNIGILVSSSHLFPRLRVCNNATAGVGQWLTADGRCGAPDDCAAAHELLCIGPTDFGCAWHPRSCQTVLAALAMRLLPALAPVLPHMAEDAWQHLPWPAPAASVFQVP